jgi:hypothetical protein
MADFYGTDAGLEAYCEARGLAVPTVDINPLLLRASVWIDATYRSRFPGYRTNQRNQVREWPRYDATDGECNGIPSTEVPIEIIEATYEAALREANAPASLTPDIVKADRVIAERVGSLAVTYSDGGFSTEDRRPIITICEDILSRLIGPTRGAVMFGGSSRA